MTEDGFEKSRKLVVPLLPLRDMVLFPYMVIPIFVGRDRSIHAIESAMKKDRKIFFALQKDAKQDDPGEEDIYLAGAIGTAIQCLKLPDGTVKVLVEGECRGKIVRFLPHEPFHTVEVREVEEPCKTSVETEALIRNLKKILIPEFSKGLNAKISRFCL